MSQSHRAGLLGATPTLASQVQYPRVAGQVASDLGSMRLLSALAEAAFPGAGYGWIIGEFEAAAETPPPPPAQPPPHTRVPGTF